MRNVETGMNDENDPVGAQSATNAENEAFRYAISLQFSSTGGKFFEEGYFWNNENPSGGLPAAEDVTEIVADITVKKALPAPDIDTPPDVSACAPGEIEAVLFLDGKTYTTIGAETIDQQVANTPPPLDMTVIPVTDWADYVAKFGEFGVEKS